MRKIVAILCLLILIQSLKLHEQAPELSFQSLDPCPADQTYDPSSKKCVVCQFPKVWDSKTLKCQQCPAGTTWDPLSNSCRQCPETFIFDSVTKRCYCPPAPFHIDSNQRCVSCLETSWSGWDEDKRTCTICHDGAFYNKITRKCSCPEDKPRLTISGKCIACKNSQKWNAYQKICEKVSGLNEDDQLLLQIAKHITLPIGIVAVVPLDSNLLPGWERLRIWDASPYINDLKELTTTWSIITFETGKMGGSGYGYEIKETYGPEAGEAFILKRKR